MGRVKIICNVVLFCVENGGISGREQSLASHEETFVLQTSNHQGRERVEEYATETGTNFGQGTKLLRWMPWRRIGRL